MMNTFDRMLDDFEAMDPALIAPVEVAKMVQILCTEIRRLREMEIHNRPILHSAMMHMPIG